MGAKVLAIAFVLLLLTFEKNAFAMAADPVTRNDRAEPPASQNAFSESSYAIHWNPPDTKENAFSESSYAIHWNPPDTKENAFSESSYAIHWNPPDTKENDFSESSYAIHWNPPDTKENAFSESSYAIHWNPPDSKENSFSESSYAIHWNPPDSAPSSSLAPEAQTRHQHMKVRTGMLFLKKNLHVGTILPEGTMFARADMPKPDGSVSTPLEPKYFGTIVSRFNIPDNSMKAKQVAETLRSCVEPINQEEPQACFSSRKAMATFATTSLGSNLARAALTRIDGHETPSTRYVVAQISQLSNHTVACHPMDFPYEVFYCHRPKEVHSLKVQLIDMKDGKTRVTATAMCHMNTSNWDEQYFELLGGERGEPICHYMPQNYIMFY